MREWGTDLLADISLFNTMSLVRLPDGLIGKGSPEVLNTAADGSPLYDYAHAGHLGNILHHDYKIEVCNKFVVAFLLKIILVFFLLLLLFLFFIVVVFYTYYCYYCA